MFVLKNIKHWIIDQYVFNYLKQFGLAHPKACVYQLIGGDTEENPNILHVFVSCIGSVYSDMILYCSYCYRWSMTHNTAIPFLYNNGNCLSRQ